MWTLANLRAALAAAGVRPGKSRGQNFMLDRNFLEFIVRTADVRNDDSILEIGAGPGQLTALLAQRARQVWAVEIDRRLADICAAHVRDFANVEIVCGDVLENRHSINSELIQSVAARCGDGLKVVSNLPYSVAATVIVGLLESELPLSLIVVLTQFELAERLVAKPDTREYGQLTVLVDALGNARIVRKAPPDLFWPRPKVSSALVAIVPARRSFARTEAYSKLKEVVHRLFAFRRKQLANALGMAGYDAKRAVRHAGLDPSIRCEALDVAGFMSLAESVAQQGRNQNNDRDTEARRTSRPKFEIRNPKLETNSKSEIRNTTQVQIPKR